MSSPPNIFPLNSDDESEFTVQVHIWLSAMMSANYKGPKKKFAPGSKVTPSFEDGRKLREKSSWATTLPRGSTAGGHWRPGTCRLRDQGERCVLSIFIDDVMLLKSIKVHMLHHTDIRPADVSLFSRKHCLAIDAFDQQPPERFYLLFADQETCTTWLCLLRSFSIFELYGRWASRTDGGLYRLWRQLELTVLQARNLGQVSPSTSISNAPAAIHSKSGQATDSDQEVLAPDVDIFCEIWLGGLLCARTSAKKDVAGGREWHEAFLFPDLPPFDKLEVVVWQQQEAAKSGKSEALGKVKIPLATFRRGEPVEGRYPVLKSGSVAGDLRIGELRLKIRVDEEIVMPFSEYESLLEVIESRNFLDWIKDLETHWSIKSANSAFISTALYKGRLVEQILDYATDEIASALRQSKNTLFRGGSVFTRAMEECMKYYGQAFLEASIGPTVRKLCAENVVIEVDRNNLSKSTRGIEKNVETLTTWCSEFWNQIYGSRNECPNELRKLFEHIRKTIARSSQTSMDEKLPWQGISAFCFLRLIVPAIINPHLWGLWNGMPPALVTRSLKHIGKVLLALSNLNTSTLKEDFMQNMTPFLNDNLKAMEDYLRTISTPVPGHVPTSSSSTHPFDRDDYQRGLNKRLRIIPHLGRETIPTLPHLLDLPRSLAIITSSVLHHATHSMFNQEAPPLDAEIYQLIAQCRVVEDAAKDRVRELAKATTGAKATSPLARPPLMPTSNLPSPIAVTSPPSGRKRKATRPATAPASESDSGGTRQKRVLGNGLEDQRVDKSRKRVLRRTTSADSLVLSTSSVLAQQLTKSQTQIPDEGGKRKKSGFFNMQWFK